MASSNTTKESNSIAVRSEKTISYLLTMSRNWLFSIIMDKGNGLKLYNSGTVPGILVQIVSLLYFHFFTVIVQSNDSNQIDSLHLFDLVSCRYWYILHLYYSLQRYILHPTYWYLHSTGTSRYYDNGFWVTPCPPHWKLESELHWW